MERYNFQWEHVNGVTPVKSVDGEYVKFEEIARLQQENDQLQLKNKELVEAVASLDICHAVRRKDKTLFLNVNTTQKTHDLIWSIKESYDRSVKSEEETNEVSKQKLRS